MNINWTEICIEFIMDKSNLFVLQKIMGHVMFDRPDAMLEKQVTLWAYGHKIYRAELFRFKDRECIMDEIYLCVLI